MSIKKFYEQCGEEPLNIRDIKIDAKKEKEKFEFDPESEITDLEWEEMKGSLLKEGITPFTTDYCVTISRMLVLFSKRKPELKLDDEVWIELEEQLRVYRQKYAERLA